MSVSDTPVTNRHRKLAPLAKLAFASGSLEEAMVGAAGIATMLFYNQVLGVSAALCGTAFLIASIIDAVSDPLVGALSDSVRTRWGRRHPFMFLSALPLAISFYCLYQPPDLSELGLFVWFTVFFVTLRIAKTFYTVPHAALGAELTDDYDERTSIFAWNWVVANVASIVLTAFVLIVIFPTTDEHANGLLNPDRYSLLALMGSVFIAVVVLFCTFATADQIPYLHQTVQTLPERAGAKVRKFYRDVFANLSSLVKNRSYVSMFTCWLVLSITGGIKAVVVTYAFIYAFEFTTEEITLQQVVRIPGALLGVAVSLWLTRKLDKKYSVIVLCYTAAFLVGLPFCLRLLGWLPDNGSVWLLVAFFGIWTIGYIPFQSVAIVIDSCLTDIADEHELNTGNRAEGMIFSIRTFGTKMTQGLGGLFGGFGLAIIGFPDNASTTTIEPGVIDGLLFMIGPLYWIIVFGGLGLAFLYNIDRQRHTEILRQLEARRAGELGSD